MIEYKKDTPTINHADLIPINNIKLEIMAKNKIFLVSNSQINKDFKVITKKVAVAVWLDIQLDELAYRITVWKKDKTNKINIVGRGIKPQFPKKPNVKIKNDFKKNINELAFELFNKISKIIL